jgi:hypothetical protein
MAPLAAANPFSLSKAGLRFSRSLAAGASPRASSLVGAADGARSALKIELVNDVPAHAGTIRRHPVLGKLDSPENILANKLTALVDRAEPKDLADVWGFCARMRLSIRTALTDAQGKAAGLFPADELSRGAPPALGEELLLLER